MAAKRFLGKALNGLKACQQPLTINTAYARIKGFEVMRALRKGQAQLWQYGGGIMGEVRLIERQFGI